MKDEAKTLWIASLPVRKHNALESMTDRYPVHGGNMKSFITLLSAFAIVILLWYVRASGQHPMYLPPSEKGGWKVRTTETQGTHSILESVVQPGTGPEPHRHAREDEGFYILEGQYEFRVGDQVIPATAGAYLFAPRGIPHTYRNVGTTPSRHLTIISPGGLEKFFEERAALFKEVPASDPARAGRYKALTEKYGLEYSADWVFPQKSAR
jgi:quercetin dioxygenase-like cupin family protein